MTAVLFFRPSVPFVTLDDNSTVRWCLWSAGGDLLGAPRDTSLRDIAASLQEEDTAVVALLPGESVLLSAVYVKAEHEKHLLSAVADQMEERLAQNLDEVHISTRRLEASARKENRTRVYLAAAIDAAKLRKMQKAMEVSGLTAHVAASEAQFMPAQNAQAQLLLEDGRVIFRLSPSIASTLEAAMFPFFLEAHLRSVHLVVASHEKTDATSIFDSLHISATREELSRQATLVEGIRKICSAHNVRVEVQERKEEAFEFLCRQWFEPSVQGTLVNLFQGAYRVAKPIKQGLLPYRQFAFVLLAFLILRLAFDGALTVYYAVRAGQMQTQDEALYHKLFPQETRIVDLAAQIRQHAYGLSASDMPEFFQMLHVLARNPQLSKRLDINHLAYVSSSHRLTVNFSTDDFSVIEQYKRQPQEPPLTLEPGATVREGNGVQGEIRIQGRP